MHCRFDVLLLFSSGYCVIFLWLYEIIFNKQLKGMFFLIVISELHSLATCFGTVSWGLNIRPRKSVCSSQDHWDIKWDWGNGPNISTKSMTSRLLSLRFNWTPATPPLCWALKKNGPLWDWRSKQGKCEEESRG